MITRPDSHAPVTSLVARRALIAVLAVLFLTFLDTTIVSVALSDVQTVLHAGVGELQWTVNGYALTFASLMMIAGSLSDRLGRKRVMCAGLIVFACGSLLGALAPNAPVLIAARVVMGIGAAASEPGTLSVIRHLYPERESRARALGAWAAVSGLALALGPVIGGVLVGLWSFRAVFFFNVIAAVLATIGAALFVPESADPQAVRFDVPGFLAAAIGLGALTFAVILGETETYHGPLVVALFVLGACFLATFIGIEHRSRAPMLDLHYFRSAPFSGSLTVAFALFFGIFSIFFFVALYLSAVVGYSAYRVAEEFAPMTFTMIAAAGITGRRVARRGPRAPMTQGCLLSGVGILASEVLLHATTPSAWLMATLALAGFGFGMSVVPVTSVALGAVPPEHSGMAASATNTCRELGAVFGVAVLGALVNAHLTANLTHRLEALHIPGNFIAIVINAIENGTVPSGVHSGASIEDKVIEAAYGAFRGGLEVALVASGIALVLAAVVAVATVRIAPDAEEVPVGD